MPNKDQIEQILFEVIKELNEELPFDQHIDVQLESPLFGQSGKLDSLGLVSLIVRSEEKIQDQLGISITIADERAMSQTKSPFTTIRNLSEYISVLVIENEKD